MKSNIISILIVISTFLACLLFSSSIVDKSMYIVGFFYDYMFPSLLPLLISIFILIDTGVLYYIAYFLQYITLPLFRINGYGALCIILSILTGFPFSTLFVCKFYKSNKISKEEAYSLILSFTIPSFSFMFTTIKSNLNNNDFLLLISCIYLSSFILLFITSRILIKQYTFITFKEIHMSTYESIKCYSFPISLKQNIIKITESLSVILGTMVYFSILSLFIESILPISNTVKGILEFSFPSIVVAKNNDLISLIIILSFSSISCIFQCSCILEEYNLKTKPLSLSKVSQVLISCLIFTIKKL